MDGRVVGDPLPCAAIHLVRRPRALAAEEGKQVAPDGRLIAHRLYLRHAKLREETREKAGNCGWRERESDEFLGEITVVLSGRTDRSRVCLPREMPLLEHGSVIVGHCKRQRRRWSAMDAVISGLMIVLRSAAKAGKASPSGCSRQVDGIVPAAP